MQCLSRINMDGSNQWTVPDLLDEKEDLVQEYLLAKMMVETMESVERTGLDVRIPKAAKSFAENVLSDWFEAIAEVEKQRKNMPYLINRELYENDEPGLSWNQSLNLKDLQKWFSDEELKDNFRDQYMFMKKRHTTNEPLSGYLNRLFPIKFILRVFASITLEEYYDPRGEFGFDGEVNLDELREKAFSTAKYAREWLSVLDSTSGPGHGAEVSVGFPEDNDKAKERFVAQFVGSKRKGNVSGGLFDLGFASLTGFSLGGLINYNSSELYFTTVGWEFAMLENPLIDTTEGWKDYFETGKRFSDAEINFLLKHIKQNLVEEWKFMLEVAKSINGGKDRPKQVESELKKTYDWEATKISQMRNGVISRMEELQLLSRHKEGREVTYKLTKLGEDSLS